MAMMQYLSMNCCEGQDAAGIPWLSTPEVLCLPCVIPAPGTPERGMVSMKEVRQRSRGHDVPVNSLAAASKTSSEVKLLHVAGKVPESALELMATLSNEGNADQVGGSGPVK